MDSTQNILIRCITSVRPHPLNQTLYETMTPESPQFIQLKDSILQQGILEPLVIRPDGTLLSGHRRLSVAQHLGLTEVPTTIKTDGDDRLLLIEFNRQRIKTLSETMREAELIKSVIAEKAAANMARIGMARDESLSEEVKIGRTADHVSSAVGMKTRTFTKAMALYEAAKTNPNAAEKLKRVDEGTLSIDAAHKAIRKLDEEPLGDNEIPDFIRFYTSWQFSENDPRFGIPHPGRIPGQIPANVIYYFSEPGDLIVDPMAGGGSTLDAAEFLGRTALGYDVVPKRPDIQQHDISTGFPPEAKGCQLIFMDPPYWNMKDEGYSDLSSSRKELDAFTYWYEKLMKDASKTVRIGGFVAVINMNQFFRLPEDFKNGYIDWPMQTYQYLLWAGMTPWSRISVTYPTSMFGGYGIVAAKKGKFMLPNIGDIIVMRRMS